MLQNYLITFARVLLRQKIYSTINVAGLALGIAATLLITLFVVDEIGYDQFHQDADRIYRLESDWVVNGIGPLKVARNGSHTGEALQREIPSIASVMRLQRLPSLPLEYERKVVNIQNLFRADSNFFSFFSFSLIEGNASDALTGPDKIILTEPLARTIFGNQADLPGMIGKTLYISSERYAVTITGIVMEAPANSHFHFDALLSMEDKKTSGLDQYCYTYIKLRDQNDLSTASPLLVKSLRKILAPDFIGAFGVSQEEFFKRGDSNNYYLRPLNDIHLHSNTTDEIEPNGNSTQLLLLSTVAGFILLLACINYMNLATARAANRAKEVGVRKTIGAERKKLVVQFMTESLAYVALATILALGIVSVFIQPFNYLSEKHFSMGDLLAPELAGGILITIIIVSFVSGIYPSFVISSFRPAYVLKGKLGLPGATGNLRNILVIAQFSISTILIAASILIYQQLRYLQNQDPGYDRQNVLCFTNAHALNNNWEAFRNELKHDPAFIEVGRSSRLPSEIIAMEGLRRKGADQLSAVSSIAADEGYLRCLDLKMIEGRYFSKEHPGDNTTVIINESAAQLFGITDLSQKEYLVGFKTKEVIGIVKDFHFESFKTEIKPLVIHQGGLARMIVRVTSGDVRQKIQKLERIWKKHTSVPFEYSFLDERLQAQYAAEERLSKLAIVATLLSIVIACLGLLGLVTYMATLRIKEIGIRKVMGASVHQIVILLSKDFLRLVLLALIIAFPISWYTLSQWLETFAYRIDFNFEIVFMSGFGMILVAFLTLSYQSIKVAMGNPVDSLRSE